MRFCVGVREALGDEAQAVERGGIGMAGTAVRGGRSRRACRFLGTRAGKVVFIFFLEL